MTKKNEITIIPATFNDLDEIVEINEKYMFYGHGVRPHFEEVLNDNATIALKCVVDGEFAGVLIFVKGIGFLGNHDELAVLNDKIEQIAKGKTIYTGDALIVKEEYRGLGIAKKLCREMIKQLKEHNVDLALYEYWVYPDGSIPVIKAFDVFEKTISLGHYENFYRDLDSMGFNCPVCHGKCKCSAMVYITDIANMGDN